MEAVLFFSLETVAPGLATEPWAIKTDPAHLARSEFRNSVV